MTEESNELKIAIESVITAAMSGFGAVSSKLYNDYLFQSTLELYYYMLMYMIASSFSKV